MTAYANAVAYQVVSHYCQESLDDLESMVDVLDAQCAAHGGEPTGEPIVNVDCPHGWAVHESETAEGVHYWAPANLEGCHAVAVKTDSGLWLSYTWNA